MQYGNLPPSTNKDNKTTNYFENFFEPTLTTSQNIDDAVLGYFELVTGDKDTGKTLAASVLYVALNNGINPMTLVDELRKLKSGKRVQVKTPVNAATIVVSTSYEDIEQNKYSYASGQIFYIPTLNTFYKLIAEPQNEIYRVESVLDYKAETVTTDVYNYFYISYSQEQNELNAYLTMLLNSNRSGTSLLGLSNTPQVSKYIIRAILP